MAVAGTYRSKPLDCWGKLEELRRILVRETYTAKERGELVVLGGVGPLTSVLCGLGPFHILSPMPIGPDMKDLRLLTKMNEVAAAQGYGGDCCATLRIALGSMLMNRFALNARTGQILKPDLHWEVLMCQGQMKAQQLYDEHWMEIPSMVIELPWQEQSGQADVDYVITQLHESIEWFEQITGRKFNDELLAESWLKEWEGRCLFGEIVMLQKTIPAPLDQRMMASFAVPLWRGAMHRPDVLEFYRMARDEVQERVANGIAALSTERLRLMHEGPSPWYPSGIMRYPNRYGALYIGSWLYFTEFSNFKVNPDGSWEVAPGPQEVKPRFCSRDDILRSIAELFVLYNPRPQATGRVDQRVRLAQQFHAQGVVFALDRGCLGNTAGAMESILALKRAGIPTISYQSACANPSEFDEGEYRARLDTFLESFGLKPLEEVKPLSPREQEL